MDLSTIQHRINNKTYKTRQTFIDDLELIVNNCLTYNGDDSCKRFIIQFYTFKIPIIKTKISNSVINKTKNLKIT